jgi:hypothetical protein
VIVSTILPSNRVVLRQILDESTRKLPFAVAEPMAGPVAVNEVTVQTKTKASNAGAEGLRI